MFLKYPRASVQGRRRLRSFSDGRMVVTGIVIREVLRYVMVVIISVSQIDRSNGHTIATDELGSSRAGPGFREILVPP